MDSKREKRGTALLVEAASRGADGRNSTLESFGFEVLRAEDAAGAVRLTETESIDIALVDANLTGVGTLVLLASERDFPLIFQDDRDPETWTLDRDDQPVYGFWRRDSGEASLAAAISGAESLFRARREFRALESQLKEREKLLSSVLKVSPVGIGVFKDRIILEVNEAVSRILGYRREELIGQSTRILFMDEEVFKKVGVEFYTLLRKEGSAEMETVYRTKSGKPMDILIRGVPLDPADPGRGTTVAVWDISSGKQMARDLDWSLTELREKEGRLTAALEEKEAMFQELKHRVKNSMALMASLIGLESSNTDTPEVREVLEHTRTRIESLASLYDLLGRQPDPNAIGLDQYLTRIVSTLSSTLVGDCERVDFKLDFRPVQCHSRVAAPLGLVVMELVVNSLKHAFPVFWSDGQESREETISMSLKKEDSQVILEVADNGVGLPVGFDPAVNGSLGMDLVRMLVNQMRGTLGLLAGPGTRFRIVVPADLVVR